jgi:hypothetical protein
MPRDAVLLSQQSIELRAVVEAAEVVDPSLRVRSLFDRAVLQLLNEAGEPVASIQNSVLLSNLDEVIRLLPDAPRVPVPVWWTEAVLPWDTAGDSGTRVLVELAAREGAALVIEDAT